MNKMAISGSEYWHWEPKVIDESAPRQRHRAGTFSDWWRHRAEFEQKSFLAMDISPNFSIKEFFLSFHFSIHRILWSFDFSIHRIFWSFDFSIHRIFWSFDFSIHRKRLKCFQARCPGNPGISVPFCMEIRIEVWNHLSLLYILYVFPKRKKNSNKALLPLYLLYIHHNLIDLNFEASPRLLSEYS